MKNIPKIPTTVILLFFSWLVFISGISMSVYFAIANSGNTAGLFKALCLFLASVFLSVLIRAFANLGQLLFDSKQVQEQFKISSLEMARNLKSISEQLQKHSDLVHDSSGSLKEQVNMISTSISSFQGQSKDDTAQIRRGLQLICEQLQAQAELISREVKILKEALISGISEDVGGLKGNIERIGCDSRDINDGITKIKTFFELIERHLDLKK